MCTGSLDTEGIYNRNVIFQQRWRPLADTQYDRFPDELFISRCELRGSSQLKSAAAQASPDNTLYS